MSYGVEHGECYECGDTTDVLNNRGGPAHDDYLCRSCIQDNIAKYQGYLEEFDQKHLADELGKE